MTSQELTQRIKELEAMPSTAQVRQEIADAYWARRRAWEKEQGVPTVTHSDGSPV